MDNKNQTVENPSLVTIVMKRIQELELCKLKNDHQGLEKVYQAALEAVEGLHDEQNKNYLLASVKYHLTIHFLHLFQTHQLII